MPISQNEILDALEKALGGGLKEGEGLTVEELSDRLSLAPSTVRRRLKAFQDRLEISWVYKTRLDGLRYHCPLYRLKS